MGILSIIPKFTSDSLADSTTKKGATDLTWSSSSSELDGWIGGEGINSTPPIVSTALPDWLSGPINDQSQPLAITDTTFNSIGGTVVDPNPPPPITDTISNWIGGTVVDPNPPPPITDTTLSNWIGAPAVDSSLQPPITGTPFSDWVGSVGNNADAYGSFGTLNAWHEVTNVPLVQAANGTNIHFQY